MRYALVIYMYFLFVYEDVIAKEFTPYESYSGLLLFIIMVILLFKGDN